MDIMMATYISLLALALIWFPSTLNAAHLKNDLVVAQRQDDIDVEFLFWNRKNPYTWTLDAGTWTYVPTPESIRFNINGPVGATDAQIDALSEFKKAGETKVIIHGWTENGRGPHALFPWIQQIKDAYIWKGWPFASPHYPNVISVDWATLASGELSTASANTQKVGVHVGKFISYLVNKADTTFTLDDFHIIGFSLGGQVAGKAGETLGGRVNRITGLDPATGSFEESKPVIQRLDKSDAKFVDVIHTTMTGGAGHLEFWPNGGSDPMPGCQDAVPHSAVCSHFRAVEYFIESMSNPSGFPSVKCDSYASFQASNCNGNLVQVMGLSATKPVTSTDEGNYYLDTNAQKPFARG